MTSLLLRIWYVDLVSRAASWTLFLPPVPFLSLSVSLSVVRWIRPSGHFQFGRNKKRRFFMWGKKRIWPEKSGFPVFSVKLLRRKEKKFRGIILFVRWLAGPFVCGGGGARCAVLPCHCLCVHGTYKKNLCLDVGKGEEVKAHPAPITKRRV